MSKHQQINNEVQTLKEHKAYLAAVITHDVLLMAMLLRFYGFCCEFSHAEEVLEVVG